MFVQIILSLVRVAEGTPFEKELVVSKFGAEDKTLVVILSVPGQCLLLSRPQTHDRFFFSPHFMVPNLK